MGKGKGCTLKLASIDSPYIKNVGLVYCMHLPAKVNSLFVQTFMANKSHSDSDSARVTGGVQVII